MDHPPQAAPEPTPDPPPPEEPAASEETQDLRQENETVPTVAVLPTVEGFPAYPEQSGVEFETMPITKPKKPPRPKVPCDPAAAAIGNGSLLGVGYALMGRRGLAVLSTLITVGLAVSLATVSRTLWLELVVVGWWVVLIAHGWFLAKRQTTPPDEARRQRQVALAVTIPVLLVFGAVRFDAAMIESNVADARQAGNCAQARDALDRRWVGDRIANAPLYVKGDDTIHACDLLHSADKNLTTALSGDTDALRSGLGRLRTVIHDLPGHDHMVATVLDRFLGQLPTKDACDTKTITDWLGHNHRDKTVLDRANEVVPKIAPKAIVECGDQQMTASNWTQARDEYQQLLDQYPHDKLVPRAKAGVTKATQAIELDRVRGLLTPNGGLPAYCQNPAPYSAAPAFGATRPNRTLFFGADDYTSRLPADWKANDAADAVLIICAEDAHFGAPVQTCPYDFPTGSTYVTFTTIQIPVRVFELKTARVVVDLTVEMHGASCPDILPYWTTGGVDLGPPSETYVDPSDQDIAAGWNALINP